MNVARNRERRQAIKQIAADFALPNPVCATGSASPDVEDGVKPGTTVADNAELREAKKRIRLPEHENEVLRRATACLSQAYLPGK